MRRAYSELAKALEPKEKVTEETVEEIASSLWPPKPTDGFVKCRRCFTPLEKGFHEVNEREFCASCFSFIESLAKERKPSTGSLWKTDWR